MWIHCQLISLWTKWPPFGQMTISNAFLKWKWFHWNLFPGVELTISQYWSGNGLATKGWQATTWTNADLVPWRIYVALGGDELSANHGLLLKLMKATTHSWNHLLIFMQCNDQIKDWSCAVDIIHYNFGTDVHTLNITFIRCLPHWGTVMPYGLVVMGQRWTR